MAHIMFEYFYSILLPLIPALIIASVAYYGQRRLIRSQKHFELIRLLLSEYQDLNEKVRNCWLPASSSNFVYDNSIPNSYHRVQALTFELLEDNVVESHLDKLYDLITSKYSQQTQTYQVREEIVDDANTIITSIIVRIFQKVKL